MLEVRRRAGDVYALERPAVEINQVRERSPNIHAHARRKTARLRPRGSAGVDYVVASSAHIIMPMTMLKHPTRHHRYAAGALTLAAAVFTCNVAFSQQDAEVASGGAWSPEEEITAEEIKKDLFWLSDDER